VTLDTILGGGGVNPTHVRSGLLVCMAFEAEGCNPGRFQVHPRRIGRVPDEVTGQASHAHRWVDVLSFCLVLVALDTLRGVRALWELNRVDACKRAAHRNGEE